MRFQRSSNTCQRQVTKALGEKKMSESAPSKILWIAIGAIIGGVISLSFEYWVKPYLMPKPNITISAGSEARGEAVILIKNTGDAVAEEVFITVWASAPFAPQTNIIEIQHTGGVQDASCEFGIYEAQLTGSGARANAINTKSKAVQIKCKRISQNEKWQGKIKYSGSGAVFGLLSNIKGIDISENQYALFSKGVAQ